MLRRLTLVLALALAVPALADPAAEAPPAAAKDGVSLQDIRTFTAVYHLVKQAYVEDKSDAELMQAAIKGLLSGLDPHSEYLDQRELTALTEDTSGAYEGLGIEVFSADGVLRVIAPIDDTPAERAGIKPGDIITRIDGKTITSENAGESVERPLAVEVECEADDAVVPAAAEHPPDGRLAARAQRDGG